MDTTKELDRLRDDFIARMGVVASNDGFLRFFDPVTGGLRNSVAVPGGATTNPVVAGGVLYVVGANGQLHAFR
jgi:sugar lactone lactonase YvrE